MSQKTYTRIVPVAVARPMLIEVPVGTKVLAEIRPYKPDTPVLLMDVPMENKDLPTMCLKISCFKIEEIPSNLGVSSDEFLGTFFHLSDNSLYAAFIESQFACVSDPNRKVIRV